jgi:guanosine-diphosphatase
LGSHISFFPIPRNNLSEFFFWFSEPPAAPQYPYEDEIETIPPTPSHDAKPAVPTTHPESYDTDPDPTKTTYCTAPHSFGDPLVQYALMIDAGSTGSRIHIYKFNNCGASPEYEYEVFKMTQPGLSSFAGKPEEAAKSLDVLLDEAVRVVPSFMRSCTPVAVKATAGLRLLPGSQSADILHAVEERIHGSYPFKMLEKDGVTIMDGKDEGVYAWITANYLLGTIKADTPKDTPTYAVLDLGGASTQIVFEPMFSSSDQRLEHMYCINIRILVMDLCMLGSMCIVLLILWRRYVFHLPRKPRRGLLGILV